MPKSRRRKGKFSPQSKKRREQIRQPATPQPTVAVQTSEAVPRPRQVGVVAPSTSAIPTAKMVAIPATSHNVTTELKAIAILAGVLLVALIVLALVLT